MHIFKNSKFENYYRRIGFTFKENSYYLMKYQKKKRFAVTSK